MSRGIAKGEPWGAPSAGPAAIVVDGDDAALAAVVAEHDPGVRLAWRPALDPDFARVVGLGAAIGRATALDLPCDAMAITLLPALPAHPPRSGSEGLEDVRPRVAVNMAVFGVAPDRLRWTSPSHRIRVEVDGRVLHDGPASGVVVANGQFLRGADVVPRGHPGDGRLEVQVYAVPRGQRRAFRDRLRTGSHVPHPGIHQATGWSIEVVALGRRRGSAAGRPLELDGAEATMAGGFRADVSEAAFVLVV